MAESMQILIKSKFSAEKVQKQVHYVPSAGFEAPVESSKKIYIGGHSMYEIEQSMKVVVDFMNAIERGDIPEVRE